MGWIWDGEVRSQFSILKSDRLYCKCQAQQDKTQNQIAQIQNAIALKEIAKYQNSAIALQLGIGSNKSTNIVYQPFD